jgi:hypothetical protein
MKDEIETGYLGTCENCHKENVMVRKIEAYGAFGSGMRGYYQICFECFKPRVKFKGSDGKTYNAPITTEEHTTKIAKQKP